jgi:hypothetical protein
MMRSYIWCTWTLGINLLSLQKRCFSSEQICVVALEQIAVNIIGRHQRYSYIAIFVSCISYPVSDRCASSPLKARLQIVWSHQWLLESISLALTLDLIGGIGEAPIMRNWRIPALCSMVIALYSGENRRIVFKRLSLYRKEYYSSFRRVQQVGPPPWVTTDLSCDSGTSTCTNCSSGQYSSDQGKPEDRFRFRS